MIIRYNNYAIIVAGGSGTRMGSEIPKQFLALNGSTILMRSMEAFYNCKSEPRLIVVLHEDYHLYWRELCEQHNFFLDHTLVKGGLTRFHSVKNGLLAVEGDEDSVVAIHDAVRPLVNKEVIDHSYRVALDKGNAVTAVKSRDSVRLLSGNNSSPLSRDNIYLIQTPQTFRYAQLQRAYQQEYKEMFTDDASVVESTGFSINLIEGSYKNVKITFPEDLHYAELISEKGS